MVPLTLTRAVTTAGTRVRISATDLYVSRFSVQAEHDNTGRIFLGGVAVAAANGISLDAKVTYTFDPVAKNPSEKTNLRDWHIDASVNTDGVMVLYFTEE